MPATPCSPARPKGLVGREVVRLWSGPGTLHLLARRPLPNPGRNRRVHVVDFAALPPLPRAESALCCLGTTIAVAGSKAAFRAVDHDAVVAFARAAQAAGVRRFAVVAALGAERHATNFYSRVKGEVEQALAGLEFATLVIARPSRFWRATAPRSSSPGGAAGGSRSHSTKPLLPLLPMRWRPIDACACCCARRQQLFVDPAKHRRPRARLGQDTVLGCRRAQETGGHALPTVYAVFFAATSW